MSRNRNGRLISFVLPLHDEADGLCAFHAELTEATGKRPDDSFEFVYINDGSRDASRDVLSELELADPRVRVLDLSRNFGHQIAITAGIDHAEGDAVIVMDTDRQDPPPVALELIAAWEQGADIVYAQRRSRQDSRFKRFTAWLYYALLHVFAEVDIPRNTGDFRLMDRRAADALRQYRERNRFVRGMVASLGFTQVGVPFDRDERSTGTTSYPLPKMLRLAADGITSFSTAPLRLITRLGLFSVVLSLGGIVYAVVQKVFWPQTTVPGWTWLVVAVLFMGGVQMLSLGVIGSYVGRIYAEVQNRPLYLLREQPAARDDLRSSTHVKAAPVLSAADEPLRQTSCSTRLSAREHPLRQTPEQHEGEQSRHGQPRDPDGARQPRPGIGDDQEGRPAGQHVARLAEDELTADGHQPERGGHGRRLERPPAPADSSPQESHQAAEEDDGQRVEEHGAGVAGERCREPSPCLVEGRPRAGELPSPRLSRLQPAERITDLDGLPGHDGAETHE